VSGGAENGFTLIELMVVVLIIAILLAIAIPTFLGAQSKAKDRSAQSSLRNSVTAAKTIFADGSDYTQATPTALAGVEPALSFLATSALASTKPKEVSVKTPAAGTFYAAALSATGSCFFIKDDVANGGTKFAKAAQADTCTGDAASTTASAWNDSW
jgi:type IV pilus assembly protein PilA